MDFGSAFILLVLVILALGGGVFLFGTAAGLELREDMVLVVVARVVRVAFRVPSMFALRTKCMSRRPTPHRSVTWPSATRPARPPKRPSEARRSGTLLLTAVPG